MLTDIPKYIAGAKTLYISKSDIVFDTVFRDNVEVSIEYLSICQYDKDKGFYLFWCDKNFNTIADLYYEDLNEALEDAKRIYQTDNLEWIQIY